MFKGGSFDVIDVPMPTKGMNQNVAPEQLPAQQTYHLENIIPSPLGYGRVRYGTEILSDISKHIEYDCEIQEIFNYTTKDNQQQLLLYVQDFAYDSISEVTVNDEESTISFKSSNKERYVVDTPIRIEFESKGNDQVSLYIKSIKVTGNRIALSFDKTQFIQGMRVKLISYSTGSLYCYKLEERELNPEPLIANLAINTVPRAVYFQRQLLICNGVDKIMKWDGENLTYVICWIPAINKKEDELKKVYDNVIKFDFNNDFKEEAYQKGKKIRIKIDEKNTELEVKGLHESYEYGADIYLLDSDPDEYIQSLVIKLKAIVIKRREDKEGGVGYQYFIGYAKEREKKKNKLIVDAKEYVQEELTDKSIELVESILEEQVYGKKEKYTGSKYTKLIEWANEIIGANQGSELLKDKKVLQLTTVQDIPDFGSSDSDNETVILYHQDYPPRLSYIKVMNNRVWGFKEGAVGLKYRKDSLTVLYSYKPESLTDWFSDVTKSMPYINMSYEHGRHDSFEAITTIGDNIIFLGRHNTQVWKGRNPTDISQFVWKATLEGGIVHGSLLLPVGNDVFFVSAQGLMSLSTFNQAKQLVIQPRESMNPFIQNCLKTVLTSDIEYRKCRAFNYNKGSFAGFKLGNYESIIAMTSGGVNGFCLFSGSFQQAYTFNGGGEDLLMTEGNKILKYQDYSTDANSYTDNGKPINFIWSLPIVNFKEKKYACKRFEIHADYSSEFVMEDGQEKRDKNFVAVNISGDLRKSFEINTPYLMDFQGDVLGEIHLDDSGGYRLGAPYQIRKTRLKFISTSFWCTLHGTISTGHFTIKNLRFYGRAEQ